MTGLIPATALAKQPSMIVPVVIMAAISAFMFISMVIAWKAFYKKATAALALVRTGMGGAAVFVDSGGFVVPIVHEMVLVSMETMKIVADLKGDDGVVTGDHHRLDLKVEFFVRVPSRASAVLAAARAFGEKAKEPSAIKAQVEGKLIAALRTVCSSKTLPELHADRDAFTDAMMKALEEELGGMGLELDSLNFVSFDVTNGKLEQVLREIASGSGSGEPSPE
ncbi:MAG: SPFH domain-containing protein [Planctomycetota bacterium]